MIKAWAFEFNVILGPEKPDYRDERQVQATYDTTLAHVANLEKLGFEGVFFSEHHFIETLSPSPHLLIAASASRTKTLKLGVMGSVLPFHQPWRMTEELGMLDYITGGRLEIGVASGVPPEFLFVGIPQEDVRPMFWEQLDFLDKALQSDFVTHEGKYWNFDDLPILPVTKRVDRRRKWMTVYSASSCRIAAQRGYRVCSGAQSVDNANKAYDAYREEADKIGYEISPDDIGIRRHVVLADTDAEAEELYERVLPLSLQRLEEQFKPVNERLQKALGYDASAAAAASGVKDAAPPAAPSRDGADEQHLVDPTKMTDIKFEDFASFEDEFIVGSPTTVADKIIDQCRRLGAGHLVAVHLMSLNKAQFDRHYSAWEKVIPVLNSAEVARREVATSQHAAI